LSAAPTRVTRHHRPALARFEFGTIDSLLSVRAIQPYLRASVQTQQVSAASAAPPASKTKMIDHSTDDDVPEDCGFAYYLGRTVGCGLLIAFAFGAIALVIFAFKAMLLILAW
jgi:hypothetical protein